jgi:hypothetical protein
MYYKLTAQYKADFKAFMIKEAVNICCVYNIEHIKDGPNVEIHLQTFLPFTELKEKLAAAPNGHIMANTLEETEKYKGEAPDYRTIDFEVEKIYSKLIIASPDDFLEEWQASYSTPVDFKPKSKYEGHSIRSLNVIMKAAVESEDYETAALIYIELKKRNAL